MLTKEQLLKSFKRPSEKVTLPDGTEVILRGLSAGELMAFQAGLSKPGKKAGEVEVDHELFGVKLLTLCIVNEKAERIFADDDDWKLLKDGAAAPYQILTQAALRLNGFAGSAEGND